MSVIAYFTNGCAPSNAQFTQYKPKERVKDKSRILVAETASQSYLGHPKPTGNCKYYLGVVNSDTGKIRVYDTQLFQVLPQIQEPERVNREIKKEERRTYDEKQEELTRMFGSNKEKTDFAKRSRGRVHSERLEKTMSEAAQGALVVAKETEVIRNSEMSELLPLCNKDAVEPKDVYNLNDLISLSEQESISQEAAALFVNAQPVDIEEWKRCKKYARYVLSHLERLPETSPEREHQAMMIMMMSYLIKLYVLKVDDLRKKDCLAFAPVSIREKLLNTFTVPSITGRTIPQRLRLKLICYICVLALIIDKFKLDLTDLTADLNTRPKELPNACASAGAKLVKSNVNGFDTWFAVLTTPLTFPKPRKPRAKKN